MFGEMIPRGSSGSTSMWDSTPAEPAPNADQRPKSSAPAPTTPFRTNSLRRIMAALLESGSQNEQTIGCGMVNAFASVCVPIMLARRERLWEEPRKKCEVKRLPHLVHRLPMAYTQGPNSPFFTGVSDVIDAGAQQ